MKLIIIASLLIATGCGVKPIFHPTQATETKPYVQSFEQLSKIDASDIKIVIDETMGSDLLGDCVVEPLGYYGLAGYEEIQTRTIKLNKVFWQNASDLDREQLIFHELGHCALNRAHTDTVIYNGVMNIPSSIMHTSHIDQGYAQNRAFYIKELLTGVEDKALLSMGSN